MDRITVTLAVVFCVATALAFGQKATSAYCGTHRSIRVHDRSGEIQYRREYCNYDYAYRVVLPKSWVVHGSRPPAPNHGFGFNPADRGSTTAIHADTQFPYIYVDASYVDTSSTKQAADIMIDATNSTASHKNFRLELRAPDWLAGLRAEFIRMSYDDANKGQIIEEAVIAQRPGTSILYSVRLITERKRLTSDEVALFAIVRRFRLQPVPTR